MKKRLSALFFCFLILLLLPFNAFAGSVPEDLKSEGEIFFAEVIEYKSFKEAFVVLKPVTVVKGDVQLNTEVTYKKATPVGIRKVEEGRIYLFAYYDEINPTYIFKTTTYNTQTLQLKGVNDNMWGRFEKYLNNGDYGYGEVPEEVLQSTKGNYNVFGRLFELLVGSFLPEEIGVYNMFEYLFYIIPILIVLFFIVSLYMYFSAKSKNEKVPGVYTEQQMKIRKNVMTVASVMVGLILFVVVGFMLLSLLAVAFM